MRAPQAGSSSIGVPVHYGRLAALVTAIGATLVAALGAVGVVGTAAGPAAAASMPSPVATPSAVALSPVGPGPRSARPTEASPPVSEEQVPPLSGHGRRVVFDESAQRVWLIGPGGNARRTYLVSGSIYDNLDPGTYAVYSRSEQAWGIDDSGEMKWFVRFTTGENAAIGFHSIPTKDGAPLQSEDELGTPTSHGCIRQAEADARALWRFAQIGDTVVVVA